MFFKVEKSDCSSRKGVISTRHGEVETPVFMPVGTQGTVKAVTPKILNEVGAQIILSNVYHLYLRPGIEVIEKFSGLHNFISWEKPILTDSGGYQILSLSSLRKIEENGVQFKSHIDGREIFFSPEKVIEVQSVFGVDIMMPLDYLVPFPSTYIKTKEALEITLNWERRAKKIYDEIKPKGILFGITQGGIYGDLREKSTKELLNMGYKGIAIGGLSVGETKDDMFRIIELTRKWVPDNMPLYLMGVGKPEDIIRAVEVGVDMFDCVLPTRNARTGWLYTSKGKVIIKNSKYTFDKEPVDKNCSCYTCKNFSRSYLRHLYVSQEITYSILSTIHNLYFFLDIMRKIRQSISTQKFFEFKKEFFKLYKES